jgi:hypothetical protein
MPDPKLIDIAGVKKHETDKAWLADVGLEQPVWLPKSQVEYYDDYGGIFTMPEWLAIEKGLI